VENEETRTLEKYDINTGVFTKINWEDLEAGMHFRLLEDTGEIVDKGTKYEICIALQKAQRDKGYWSVNCEPLVY